ncbi:hypothetical protein RJ639_007458 [Escallonia herrerae]|uniref:J domain-containing protein n=1 Tax=Escallonia herrerae TaxID=1293975 RepID=A0AA89AZX6_9ASTE|nr:hypothetical protein RJ639_007458 [Escallonia herrerae]
MEYYKALGLGRNATKGEIKEAFRKLALQFHPDKHSSSPKSVRDGATLRFKQASEAYEVLIDDHKRAHYDRSRTGGFPSGGNGYGYHHYSRAKYYSKNGHGYGYSKAGNADGFASKFEIAIRFLTTRAFLLNAAFVG